MRRRTGEPWMPAAEWGHLLSGLTINLLVPDVAAGLPFLTEVLGLRALYSDPDFAALEGDGGIRMMLHADHTYSGAQGDQVREGGRRGAGVEIRIMGLDPDEVEARASRAGFQVLAPATTTAHGWREVRVQDAHGYTFAVGILA